MAEDKIELQVSERGAAEAARDVDRLTESINRAERAGASAGRSRPRDPTTGRFTSGASAPTTAEAHRVVQTENQIIRARQQQLDLALATARGERSSGAARLDQYNIQRGMNVALQTGNAEAVKQLKLAQDTTRERERARDVARREQDAASVRVRREMEARAERAPLIAGGEQALRGLPRVIGVTQQSRAMRLRMGAGALLAEGDVEGAAEMRLASQMLERRINRQQARASLGPLERMAATSFAPAMASLAFMFGGMPITQLEGRLVQAQRGGLTPAMLQQVTGQGLAGGAAFERLAAQGAPQRTGLARLGELASTGAERAGLGGLVPIASAGLQGAAAAFNLASVGASIAGLIAAVAANSAATAANTAALVASGGAAASGGGGLLAAARGAVVPGLLAAGGAGLAMIAGQQLNRLPEAQRVAAIAATQVSPFGQVAVLPQQFDRAMAEMVGGDAMARVPAGQRLRAQAAFGAPGFEEFRRAQRDQSALQENAPEVVTFEQEQIQKAQQLVSIRRQELAVQMETRQEEVTFGRMQEDHATQRQDLVRGYQHTVRDAMRDEARAVGQITVQHGRALEDIEVQFSRTRQEAAISFEEAREDVRERAGRARRQVGRDFEAQREELAISGQESSADIETGAQRGFRNVILGQIGGLAGALISVALQRQDAQQDLALRQQRGLARIGRAEARSTGAGSSIADQEAEELARIAREERRTLGPGGRIERAEAGALTDEETRRKRALEDATEATASRISAAGTAFADAQESLNRVQQTELARAQQDIAARTAVREAALQDLLRQKMLVTDWNQSVQRQLDILRDLGDGLDQLMTKLGITRTTTTRPTPTWVPN